MYIYQRREIILIDLSIAEIKFLNWVLWLHGNKTVPYRSSGLILTIIPLFFLRMAIF